MRKAAPWKKFVLILNGTCNKVITRITIIVNLENIEMKASPQDAVAIFKETAKGTGKIKFYPHEAYEEELEERVD